MDEVLALCHAVARAARWALGSAPGAAHPSSDGQCGLIPRGDFPVPSLTGATASSPASPPFPWAVLGLISPPRSCARAVSHVLAALAASAARPLLGWWGPAHVDGGASMMGLPPPGWVCAASSVSASVPAAAARSCCSVVNLCWCSVPGSGLAAVAGSGQTMGPACSLPCSSCTTSPTCHGGCSPLSLCKPPPCLPPAPGTAGGVLVMHRGLWACFRGL